VIMIMRIQVVRFKINNGWFIHHPFNMKMVKTYKFWVLLYFFILVRNVCYSQIINEYSEVVFSRGELLMGIGSLQKLRIKNNNKLILKFSQNSLESTFIPIGENTISCRIIRKTNIKMNLEPNKIYYINVRIGGLFLDKPRFKILKVLEKNS
jgi:hypothetical protein